MTTSRRERPPRYSGKLDPGHGRAAAAAAGRRKAVVVLPGLLVKALAGCRLLDLSSSRLTPCQLQAHSVDPETQALLIPFTDAQHEPDAAVREQPATALQKINHRLLIGDLLGQAFMGLSLGSVLLLAALGLAITLRPAGGD